MCGINGIVRFNHRVEKREIECMTSMLAHRGPDGDGIWLDNNVAIGHRRLSIIDLETGRQPMCNEDETVWITFNGEIYNFLELRERLVQKGHRFRSHSDTEVIIHSYEEWGDDCVDHFRGMFAFGIVDKKNKRLFLARDHLGIKPLVYYSDGVISRSPRDPGASDGQGRDFDGTRRRPTSTVMQYIPAPRSVFKQVRKLPRIA
jgi:asparagine synthase (glutamine-hydrolysing)